MSHKARRASTNADLQPRFDFNGHGFHKAGSLGRFLEYAMRVIILKR
jgi:hypothetical protein